MLTKRDTGLLANLWHSDAYRVLIDMSVELQKKWQAEQGTGETEFQYLKSCLIRDGKIEGVRALLNEIERLGNSSV